MRTDRLERAARAQRTSPVKQAPVNGTGKKTLRHPDQLRDQLPDHRPDVGAQDLQRGKRRGNGVGSPLEIFGAATSPQSFSDGVKYFYEVVIPQIKACRGRCAIVFDIDNTLFDTRWRTLEAAHRYGKANKIPKLAKATIEQIGCDGADTCERLGFGKGTVTDGFSKFWLDFFWNPENFSYDKRIEQTIKLLQDAKDAGAEIFYLTGRIERSREGTRNQISQLPDGDDAHLIMKPRLGIRTDRFKAKKLRNGLDTDPPVTIVGFVTEGRRDIRHIQRNTKTKALWFDFPVDREGYALAKGTPMIPW